MLTQLEQHSLITRITQYRQIAPRCVHDCTSLLPHALQRSHLRGWEGGAYKCALQYDTASKRFRGLRTNCNDYQDRDTTRSFFRYPEYRRKGTWLIDHTMLQKGITVIPAFWGNHGYFRSCGTCAHICSLICEPDFEI